MQIIKQRKVKLKINERKSNAVAKEKELKITNKQKTDFYRNSKNEKKDQQQLHQELKKQRQK